MTADETFSELRALLAREPERDDWISLVRLLDALDAGPPAERERFDACYGGHLELGLDRWPADVSAIDWDETSARGSALARTMRVEWVEEMRA